MTRVGAEDPGLKTVVRVRTVGGCDKKERGGLNFGGSPGPYHRRRRVTGTAWTGTGRVCSAESFVVNLSRSRSPG